MHLHGDIIHQFFFSFVFFIRCFHFPRSRKQQQPGKIISVWEPGKLPTGNIFTRYTHTHQILFYHNCPLPFYSFINLDHFLDKKTCDFFWPLNDHHFFWTIFLPFFKRTLKFCFLWFVWSALIERLILFKCLKRPPNGFLNLFQCVFDKTSLLFNASSLMIECAFIFHFIIIIINFQPLKCCCCCWMLSQINVNMLNKNNR